MIIESSAGLPIDSLYFALTSSKTKENQWIYLIVSKNFPFQLICHIKLHAGLMIASLVSSFPTL